MRAEVGKYVLCYGTQAARKGFSPRYSEYEIKQKTVNNWEKKLQKIRSQFPKVGKPSKTNGGAMLKIKEVIIGIRLSGAVISRKMVLSIGTGVLKAKNPNLIHRQNLEEILY